MYLVERGTHISSIQYGRDSLSDVAQKEIKDFKRLYLVENRKLNSQLPNLLNQKRRFTIVIQKARA